MTYEELDDNTDDDGEDEEEELEKTGWGTQPSTSPSVIQTLPIETGRGNIVMVSVGAPFIETINDVAQQANYGGYFRVYLNGDEIVNPAEAPASIQAGQRIAITSYDKVG